MDGRQQRGALIAATQQLVNLGNNAWKVPSQSGKGSYTVNLDATEQRCTCPDCREGGYKCKHQWAAEFTLTRVTQSTDINGTTTTTTESLTVKAAVAPRRTYKQDWPSYNAAQCNERQHFHELLGDLCDTIPEPAPVDCSKGGRPSITLRDGVFAACLKVFSLTSARRFDGELDDAHERGYIGCKPHFNYALGVLDDEPTTPILYNLIGLSSLPLAKIETNFAVDSSGFSTRTYSRWFDEKHNAPKKAQIWYKVHACVGVKTQIVTSLNVTEKHVADSPELPGLVNKTSGNFKIVEVSADKAYAGNPNFDAVEAHGAKFYPAFRDCTTGGVGGSFEKAFHYFQLHKEEYLTHYHKRSNSETAFSMIKRKFGEPVRAKKPVSQINEILAKVLCHNVCVLIQEMYVQGIDPTFWRNNFREDGPMILPMIRPS